MSGMSAVAACPQSSIGNDPLALPSPTSLPPPVSNSSCLFTQCHPLYASYCTGVLYWSFSFNISPSNEYSGLSSFRMDWLDLLAVQGTLKSLLQHHSSKTSMLECSAFFIVQLSHPYMTTGKTMALTRWAFVGKVMSLLFSMLSRLVIGFLPRIKHLFNFMAAATICSDFGAPLQKKKSKVCNYFHCFSSICHDVMGPDVMNLVFRMLSF